MRVPAIAWWPERITPGVTSTPVSTMDIFLTVLALAGVVLPTDSVIDGNDVSALLTLVTRLPDRPFFYRRNTLFACRRGSFKAHFKTQGGYGQAQLETREIPLLLNVAHDPSKRFDFAAHHPEVLKRIKQAVEAHKTNMTFGPNQIDDLVPAKDAIPQRSEPHPLNRSMKPQRNAMGAPRRRVLAVHIVPGPMAPPMRCRLRPA